MADDRPCSSPEPLRDLVPATLQPCTDDGGNSPLDVPLSQDTALGFLVDARRLVDQAGSVPELKEIANKAAAVATYARRAGESLALVNDAQEIRIRAERRAGELLWAMEKAKGAKGSGSNQHRRREVRSHAATAPPKLQDIGVTKSQSSRWQQQAAVPEREFERWIRETRARGEELSSSALRKLALQKARKKRVLDIQAKAEGRAGGDSGLITDISAVAGRFPCVYADPPWRYRDTSSAGAAEDQYPTMSVEEIEALPVGDLLPKDGGHLWLWTTWPKIRDGVPHRVLKAWGLEWSGEITWDKEVVGPGRYVRSQTEVLILATRGKLPLLHADQGGLVRVKRTQRHSAKPEQFRALIERLSPGPRIELFSRTAVEGWSRWGLEA